MYDFLIYFSRLSPLLVIMINLPLGLIVYFNNKHEKLNLYYLLFSILMSMGGLACFIQGITRTKSLAIYADQLYYIAMIFIPVVYNRFTQLFTRINRKKTLYYFLPVTAFLVILNFTSFFRSDVILKFDNRYIIEPNFGWYIFMVYFFLLLAISFLDLFRAILIKKKQDTMSIKFFIVGSIFALFCAVFYYLLVPDINSNLSYSIFNLLSSFFGVIFGMFMVYNILYLKFLDVEIILKRSSYFLVLFLLVILPFVMVVNYLSDRLFALVGGHAYLITAILWTIFILFSEYIKEWMKRMTDSLFYAADYNYDKVLDRVNRKLSEITDIYFLLYSLHEDITKYLKVKNAGIFLPNKTRTKYYYVELEEMDNFIDSRKRSKLLSISTNHSLFTVIQKVQGNILVREELLKTIDYNEDIKLQECLTVIDMIGAEVLIGSVFKNRLNGILVVTKKKSGERFKPKDFRLLRFMINQGSLVLMRIFEIEEKTRIAIEKKMHMEHKIELEEKNNQLGKALIELKGAQDRLIEEEQLTAMGKLSGEVAHDIRNPLSSMNRLFTYVKQEDMINNNDKVILSLYDAIEKSDFAEKAKALKSLKYLLVNNKEINSVIEETIQINDKLRKIADDFLDYSRTSKDIPTEKVKVKELLLRIIKQFNSSDDVNKYKVILKVADIPESTVVMFEHQLQKIFMNIIDNAIKAVIENDIDYKEVTVGGYETKIGNQEMIGVFIKDNGVGIPAEHLNTIFKPFYTKRKNLMGTGLGLAIVKKLVEDANGDITVESKENEGTEFKLFLPCHIR